MAVKTGIAYGYKDLLNKLRLFVSNANKAENIVKGVGNVGNGYLTDEAAAAGAPMETWTVTATGVGPGASFSVVGSVSGAQAAATSGVDYDNTIVSFKIVDGAVAFAIGDSFTFDVAVGLGTEKWAINRWDTNVGGTGEYELMLQGPGSTASDAIYVGIRTFSDAYTHYHNWILNGYTGYSSASTFFDMIGSIHYNVSYLPLVLLSSGQMQYWFVANGRRMTGAIKIGAIYTGFYMGFILPYGDPTTYPYPLVIGGSRPWSSTPSNMSYSSTDSFHSLFFNPVVTDDPGTHSALQLLTSSWQKFGNSYSGGYCDEIVTWPYIMSYAQGYYDGSYDPHLYYGNPNIDGSFPVFPIILTHKRVAVYGEFQGCYCVHGTGIASEDEIVTGGRTYKVFQNIFRTDARSFWALLWE